MSMVISFTEFNQCPFLCGLLESCAVCLISITTRFNLEMAFLRIVRILDTEYRRIVYLAYITWLNLHCKLSIILSQMKGI